MVGSCGRQDSRAEWSDDPERASMLESPQCSSGHKSTILLKLGKPFPATASGYVSAGALRVLLFMRSVIT